LYIEFDNIFQPVTKEEILRIIVSKTKNDWYEINVINLRFTTSIYQTISKRRR
jgi:hypothetical protein